MKSLFYLIQLAAAFGFAPRSGPLRLWQPWASQAKNAVHDDNAGGNFLEWAQNAGVVAPNVEVSVLSSGIRGVRALDTLEANKPFITVPAKLSLETTSLSRVPPSSLPAGYIKQEAWAASKWYVRLAVMLLQERDLGPASPLQPWIATLPTQADFRDLPLYWTQAEKEALQYQPVLDAVDAQRAEYTESFKAISNDDVGSFDLAAFEWALHNVRSRAFSGAFEGGSFAERALQAGFTAVLAGGALVSGAAEPLQVVNGVLAVVLTTLLRDFVTSSQGELKRFCLCPAVDMINHKGGTSSDVAYEYFSNNFAVSAGQSFGKGKKCA